MTTKPTLQCKDDSGRRALVRKAPLNGFDYLELGCDHTELRVFFLGKAPEKDITAAQLSVDGGRRIRDIRVLRVLIERSGLPDVDDCMVVTVDKPGDSSTYRLCIFDLDEHGRPKDEPPADFDPRYACVCFSFMAQCPSDLDCATQHACDGPTHAEPVIDYLAKDYASFRRMMLDRLALVMPDWQERHVPDLGITLVELLAYVGDQLSYFQDAVATEAYLDTCRQRISARRHMRLVDYRLHEGCNARAWVSVWVSQDLRLDARSLYFVSSARIASAARILTAEQLPAAQEAEGLVFEPLLAGTATHIDLYRAHNEIHFHTWDEAECCIPKGATSATLVDAAEGLRLSPCDVLVFEEVIGPRTGDSADADCRHRHAVRLTKVTRTHDPLTKQKLVNIEWCQEDALPFPLCLSTTSLPPKCDQLKDVSVARGNIVLVDHGLSVEDDLGQVPLGHETARCADDCTAAEVRRAPGRFGPSLPRGDVTHAQPLPPCKLAAQDCGDGCGTASASAAVLQDPREALPEVRLDSYPAAPNGQPAFGPGDVADPTVLAQAMAHPASGDSPAAWLRGQLDPASVAELDRWAASPAGTPLPESLRARVLGLLRSWVREWLPRADLLGSGPDDRHFVVEVDDEHKAWLRFGDGDCGRHPDAGESFRAHYRVGNGPAGNLGAERLTRIVFREGFPNGAGLEPRNPIWASGGLAPERVDEAKLRAPHSLHRRLERAITPADYAAIVQRDFPNAVQRAAAVLRWNGRGAEVLVAVDALGQAEADEPLLCRIERHLERYRRIGHAVQVVTARRIPLLLALTVCVKPSHLQSHVKAALLDALGSKALGGGRLGWFHPDKLSFGEGVASSRLVGAAQAVEGVESVLVTRLERLGDGPHGELESGLLPLGPMEVAQLDNDPDFPEHGQLTLTMKGGR